MTLERKEKVGGGDNSMEIAEEEARVNHGGPLQSRRKTGKLAPEMGRDYVPSEQILNQPKQDSDDVGFSADSQYAIGEDEIIEVIDEKIAQEKELNKAKSDSNGQTVQIRANPETQVWHNPQLADGTLDKRFIDVAKKRNQTKIRGAKWPIVEEKKT